MLVSDGQTEGQHAIRSKMLCPPPPNDSVHSNLVHAIVKWNRLNENGTTFSIYLKYVVYTQIANVQMAKRFTL